MVLAAPKVPVPLDSIFVDIQTLNSWKAGTGSRFCPISSQAPGVLADFAVALQCDWVRVSEPSLQSTVVYKVIEFAFEQLRMLSGGSLSCALRAGTLRPKNDLQ